ncbi:uncharacterized protein LOC113272804 [Papaver somniferum]|uniref:uncharacterized protein LOC113272804 n=1 Tax=Papaver somniferum TaxID=3469 RepID=UPI000E7048E0|nr:uncharacterized protein LOC113272804 [Papaver somniferum]
MKEYMYPTRASQPSCIILPADDGQFELKASTIHMLPVFRGADAENPYHHVRDFEDICGTLHFDQMPEESLKLRLFSFSLKEKAKSWMNALQPHSIGTWEELTKEFFKKFFPNHKTVAIRQSLDVSTRSTVESMYNGAFIDKSSKEAWNFLFEVAEKSQQWESIREPSKTTHVAKVHRIESDFEGNAKIASLARKVEAITLEPRNVKITAPTLHEQFETAHCAAYHGSDHLVDSCPDLQAFQESKTEQANALYHKQENNPYSQTYNSGWRNHPNFSWSKGHVQGGATSNNQGYSYPRNSQVQLHIQYPIENMPSFNDGVNQMNHNLLQYQKLNDQRFASLELKLGQICDALNEGEKGEPQSSESKSDSPVHITPQTTSSVEKESEHDTDSKNSTDVNVPLPSYVHVAPFPQRLVQQKGSHQYNEMLEMFKQVNINIPFLEEIKQIPAYAKFLKNLCTQKGKHHVHKCAFLTEQLGLGELKPTPVTLQLAKRSI